MVGSHSLNQEIHPNPKIKTFNFFLTTELYHSSPNDFLVGGWTNPVEQICSSNWIISPGKVKHKSAWNHHQEQVSSEQKPWLY